MPVFNRIVGRPPICPTCKSELNPQTQICPKCSATRCANCLGPLESKSTTYLCTSQQCLQYQKKICLKCTVIIPEFWDFDRTVVESTEQTVLEGDNWGLAALLIPIIIGVVLESVLLCLGDNRGDCGVLPKN
jgi:hypothetical protein